jgi:hypothetical protein
MLEVCDDSFTNPCFLIYTYTWEEIHVSSCVYCLHTSSILTKSTRSCARPLSMSNESAWAKTVDLPLVSDGTCLWQMCPHGESDKSGKTGVTLMSNTSGTSLDQLFTPTSHLPYIVFVLLTEEGIWLCVTVRNACFGALPRATSPPFDSWPFLTLERAHTLRSGEWYWGSGSGYCIFVERPALIACGVSSFPSSPLHKALSVVLAGAEERLVIWLSSGDRGGRLLSASACLSETDGSADCAAGMASRRRPRTRPRPRGLSRSWRLTNARTHA